MTKAHLKLDQTYLKGFLADHELAQMEAYADLARKILLKGTGAGHDFLGWLNLPRETTDAELEKIEALAKACQEQAEVLVVLGIGGSFLGAKACYEALKAERAPQGLELVFLGQGLSPNELAYQLQALAKRDFCVNVISKSGETLETALAFRLVKATLVEKYGRAEAAHRIIVTTDPQKGALREQSEAYGYQSLAIPQNIGGRFSVLTPVGLFPLAAAGLPVTDLLRGAAAAEAHFTDTPFQENEALQYATLRQLLAKKGYDLEILAFYDAWLEAIGAWWQQLFAESEGKDGQGIFPTTAQLTRDLHSVGQFIQDGQRSLFETVLSIKKPASSLLIPRDDKNWDGLNYLADQSLEWANEKAQQGTLLAHYEGGVPNVVLTLEQLDAWHLGYLLYFFEFAVAISGYLQGVNPFDQPAVEAYKKNMFALLNRPGYGEQAKRLKALSARLTSAGEANTADSLKP